MKHTKRLACIALAMTMIFSCFSAFAENTETSEKSKKMEQAILGAKERIQLSDETYVLEDCTEHTYRGVTEYQITWKSRNEYVSDRISVSADETGNIWQYSAGKSGKQITVPACTEQEATDAANAFLQRMNEQILAESELSTVSYSKYDGYNVVYTRLHNGIVVDNTAQISVDSETKTVTNFYASWDRNATFPEGEMISTEQAKEVFCKEVGYQLAYHSPYSYFYSESQEKQIKLIYTLKGTNKFIDAFTGETLTSLRTTDDNAREESGALKDSNSAVGGGVSLSEEEKAHLAQMNKLISEEKAEKTLRDMEELSITKDMLTTSVRMGKAYNGHYAYSFYFDNGKENEEYRFAQAQICAEDGMLLDYSSYPNILKTSEKTEKEQAEEKDKNIKAAKAFLEKYYPDYASRISMENAEVRGGFFPRVHNGIPFVSDGFTFSYENGNLKRFHMGWTEGEIPEPDETVKSLDALYEVALSEGRFGLRYMPVYEENTCTMRAVYFLLEQNEYHPVSLLPLDYNMKEIKNTAYAYTDLSGHYAEKAIKTLYEAEILLTESGEDKFRPEETITQEEYLTLLSTAMRRGVSRVYPTMIEMGVLGQDEVAPEKPITRMEGIRYFVRFLDEYDLAEKPEIFAGIYTDVKEEDRGYAGIAAGYGIVNSAVSELYPENPLRRADAMIMMYNWLKR